MNTKERIFETALNLFSQKGFSATSVREITRETGLTVSSFYNHFKSKDELLQAVYDYYTSLYVGAEYETPNWDDLLNQPDLHAVFSALTAIYLDSMKNEKLLQLTRIIVMEQYTNKTAGEIAFRDRRRMLTSMETLFEKMSEKGLIRVKDPGYMGRMMGCLYLSLSSDTLYYRFFENKDPDEILRLQMEKIDLFIQKML